MRGAFNLVDEFGRCGYADAHYEGCEIFYRYDGSAEGVVKTIAFSRVLIGPHGLGVGPVETGGDFFYRGRAAVRPWVLNGRAVIYIPHSRGAHHECAVISPTHPGLERSFDVEFILIERAAEVLGIVEGFTAFKRVANATRHRVT